MNTNARFLAALVVSAFLGGAIQRGAIAHATPSDTPSPPPGNIMGHISLIPGVPMTSAWVSMPGTGWAVPVHPDANGNFRFISTPLGTWDVLVTGPSELGITPRTISVRSASGVTSDVGDVVMAKPGAVAGKVISPISGTSSEDYDLAVVGIPALGIYTQLGVSGQFLLTNVPPGNWTVSLSMPNFPLMTQGEAVATVKSGALVNGIELGHTIVFTTHPISH